MLKVMVISSGFIFSFLLTSSVFSGGSAEKKGNPEVIFSTNLGDFTVEFYPDKAPETCENFLKYVDSGFYDGTIFHRVIPGFVIQGGGFTKDMKQKRTRPSIKNEADNGLKNGRGWLSMARTQDVNSATSQFFINLKDNEFLDHGVRDYGYAVFAQVTSGMDTIDKIAKVKTSNSGRYSDVPVEPVTVISAKRK
ncbi:MAG: peptidylprolyl isomerase [Candidatus Aureabacteria bacterium]|nr:peptidylprolyl isomerase [Candidatus Auribacterota bacterium]